MHRSTPIGRNSYILTALTLALTCCGLAQADWPPATRLPQPDVEKVGILPPSVSAERNNEGLWDVTFRYQAEDTPREVSLAGAFNSWSPRSKPLERGSDGIWRVTIMLGAGTYEYKFVRNGGEWIRDPANPDGVPDNHGGQNSVLRLGEMASLRESNAGRGDGKIELAGLQHDAGKPRFVQPLSNGRLLIRLRTLARDVETAQVALKSGPRHDMHVEFEDDLFTHWQALVPLPARARAGHDHEVTYTFVLRDGHRTVSHYNDFTARYRDQDVFRTPEWARHAVWYQIMPDRFRNGSTDNDPDPVRPWRSAWFEASPWEGTDGQTFYKWFVFSRLYGGDIAGMEQQLDYLKELGVNALYLNPVFESESHHKYNATNYLHIDHNLGGGDDYEEIVATEDLDDPSTWKWTTADKRFLQFIKAAHAKGFKVILDGVWNHVGTRHPAFKDVQARGRDSQYADWFEVTSWDPFEYEGWAGHDALPVFAKTAEGLRSQAVKQHIFNVTKRWMDPDGDGDPSDGIDGWRLDVPMEIAMPFWPEWRAVVKGVNPDAYITGEVWDRADAWLEGDKFDAVMNYQFAKAGIRWIVDRRQKITPSQIDRRLAELRMAYPAEATYVMQNLLDSHDTDRIASMCFNPDRDYDGANRIQDNGPDYNGARPDAISYARARLLALLQMTYVGAPMIYYGDEVGMFGADDPTCRKPMLWADLEPYADPQRDFVMTDHLKWYKRIIALRNDHKALRTGDIQTLLTDDQHDIWSFARHEEGEALIIALNASAEDRAIEIPLPEGAPQNWKVLFSGGGEEISYSGEGLDFTAEHSRLKVRVPGLGGTVLMAQ